MGLISSGYCSILERLLVPNNCILHVYLSNLTDLADLLVVNNPIIYSPNHFNDFNVLDNKVFSVIAKTQFMIISGNDPRKSFLRSVFLLLVTFSKFLSLSGFNLESVLPNEHLLLFKPSNLQITRYQNCMKLCWLLWILLLKVDLDINPVFVFYTLLQ